MNVLRQLLIGVALALCAASALAHKASDSYLRVTPAVEGITAQWDISLRDLDEAIGLDADGDGAITWAELRARHDAIAAYALARLTLRAGEITCPLTVTEHLFDEHSDGGYAVMRLASACLTRDQPIAIDYRMFFDLDPQHRGLASVTIGGRTTSAILSPAAPTARFAPDSGRDQFARFLVEGIEHILTGYDHLAFLLLLVLPIAWRAAPGAFKLIALIVTAFTVAHSITLAAAVLGWVRFPAGPVEALILATIVATAIANLVGLAPRHRIPFAFTLGLIHGLGFANALADLGLAGSAVILPLAAFNVGVEIGQLAVVGAALILIRLLQMSLPSVQRRPRGVA